jgi:hypothetical protein
MADSTDTTTDPFEWIARGAELGFTAPAVCAFHEGVPTSGKEDDFSETSGEYGCIHIVRLLETEEIRTQVEQNIEPTDCASPTYNGEASAVQAWLTEGQAGGWASTPVCFAHDEIPRTLSEEMDDDPCVHVLRLYANNAEQSDMDEWLGQVPASQKVDPPTAANHGA